MKSLECTRYQYSRLILQQTIELNLVKCREAARAKGVDEFVRHLSSHDSSPTLAHQMQCILQRWQDLDAAGPEAHESMDDVDSQADDDPDDMHSNVEDSLNEAESIHAFGKACCSCRRMSLACFGIGVHAPCP